MNSRIIVDTYAWNRFQPNSSVSVSAFGRNNNGDEEDYDEYDSDFEDSEMDDALEIMGKAEKPHARPLTQDQLLLCTTILKGYSLKDKKWRK